MRMSAKPLEDFAMWAMLMEKKPEADIQNLKELVHKWMQMATQKTAGQRGGNDISWDNLERVKMGILCEAVRLVISGKLNEMEKCENECDREN